jgi:hypothetical protein
LQLLPSTVNSVQEFKNCILNSSTIPGTIPPLSNDSFPAMIKSYPPFLITSANCLATKKTSVGVAFTVASLAPIASAFKVG